MRAASQELPIPHERFASVRTGDVLLFSGWNSAALVLRVATWSEYTHAAIAVWLRTAEGRRLHCFEAGPCPLPDVLRGGRPKAGCRLAPIDLIMEYYTRLAVRKIRVERDATFYATLRDFMREYHEKSFRSMLQLAMLNGGLAGPPHGGDGNIFCSELCSTWLERVGVLKAPVLRDLPHHRSSPGAFAATRHHLRHVMLGHNYVYPDDAFEAETLVVHEDEGADEAAKANITAALIVGLLSYIALTVTCADAIHDRSG
jgi:hypothetical protein